MGIINVLTPHMANMIAAGEVVERPASAVKEIIENSIDAGSRRIEVEIKNGGTSYIRVTDDGCGIAPDDVEKALLRHATSKIKEPSDMLAISTMGFRGEALAAISAVSKVDIFTKTAIDIGGTHLCCEGGENVTCEETGCPKGTTVIVRDIFYNVPARMKFLKKDSTEGAYCEGAVTSAALSHPEISFRFVKDGRENFFTRGDGSLFQVISAMYGRETAQGLIPIKGSFPNMDIKGYVSPPGVSRSSRGMQYFLVNGRPVKGKILSAAIDGAYKGKMMQGRYPVCFLDMKVPYTAVDVNVHPAKLEVKFARENEVYSAIYHSVVTALEDDMAFPEMEEKAFSKPREEEKEYSPGIVVSSHEGELVSGEGASAASELFKSTKADFGSKSSDDFELDESMFKINKMELVPRQPKPEEGGKASGFGQAFDGSLGSAVYNIKASRPVDAEEEHEDEPEENQDGILNCQSDITVLGQAFGTYIIAQQGDELWLIDKHAAHEKLIYNSLVIKTGNQDMQTLLTPVPVNLSPEEKQACLDNMPLLEKSGFEIDDYGMSSLAVRSAPVYLDEEDIPYVLSDMAQKLLSGIKPGSPILDELLKSIACKAAVKGGSFSGKNEMQSLAEKVLKLPDVRNCPHGRPVAVSLSRRSLEKQFKRVL